MSPLSILGQNEGANVSPNEPSYPQIPSVFFDSFHRIRFYNINIVNQCLLSVFLDRKNAPMCLQTNPRII